MVSALFWKLILGEKPASTAPVSVRLDYLQRGALLISVAMVCMLIATIGSIILARRAREQYAIDKENMLKDLIEGAQNDLKKPRIEENL